MQVTPDDKTRRYRWVIFWVLAFGYILVYFHRLCPAVVAVDMMKDLQTGGSLTGFLSAAYFYSYAAMQLPAGRLSDSWGPRNTITVFFLVAFVGSVLLGFASSAAMAIAGRLLVGVGVAMLFVPTMKILSEWFTPVEFAPMTGILMAMGGVGSLSAATPLVLLFNQPDGRLPHGRFQPAFLAPGHLVFFRLCHLFYFRWTLGRAVFHADLPFEQIPVRLYSIDAGNPALSSAARFTAICPIGYFTPESPYFSFQRALYWRLPQRCPLPPIAFPCMGCI